MSVTLNGHVYDISQFYGYGYLQTNADTGLIQFPNSIFTDMLAELAAASAILSGGISPSTAGNIIVSDGSLWRRSQDGAYPVILNGNLTWLTDATSDIGGSGTGRPRDLRISRNALIGGTMTVGSTFAVTDGASTMTRTTDGAVLTLAPTFATFSGIAFNINATRAATAGYLFANFSANSVSQFSVTGNGLVTAANTFAYSSAASGTGVFGFTLTTSADSGKGWKLGIDTTNRFAFWRQNDSNDYGWQLQKADGTVVVNIANGGSIITNGGTATNVTTGTVKALVSSGFNIVMEKATGAAIVWTTSDTNRASIQGRTGPADGLIFYSGASTGVFEYTSAGIQAVADATFDIGNAGANRFRDLNLSRNATIGGRLSVAAGGDILVTASSTAASSLLLLNGSSGFAAGGGVFIAFQNGGNTQATLGWAHSYQAVRATHALSGSYTFVAEGSHATNPNGLNVVYSVAAPNGTGNLFISCDDSSATRFTVRSNGGIANFSANNVNLSDERTKRMGKLLDGAVLSDAFRRIEFSQFYYNDQTHEDWNLGFSAQALYRAFEGTGYEDSIVDQHGWQTGGEWFWAVYEADLAHAAMAVLQHQIKRVDNHESRLDKIERHLQLAA
jgi:hypothetical protein